MLHVVQRVGYGSEAAFSATFKREIGVAPGAWRRNRAHNEEAARAPIHLQRQLAMQDPLGTKIGSLQ